MPDNAQARLAKGCVFHALGCAVLRRSAADDIAVRNGWEKNSRGESDHDEAVISRSPHSVMLGSAAADIDSSPGLSEKSMRAIAHADGARS